MCSRLSAQCTLMKVASPLRATCCSYFRCTSMVSPSLRSWLRCLIQRWGSSCRWTGQMCKCTRTSGTSSSGCWSCFCSSERTCTCFACEPLSVGQEEVLVWQSTNTCMLALSLIDSKYKKYLYLQMCATYKNYGNLSSLSASYEQLQQSYSWLWVL